MNLQSIYSGWIQAQCLPVIWQRAPLKVFRSFFSPFISAQNKRFLFQKTKRKRRGCWWYGHKERADVGDVGPRPEGIGTPFSSLETCPHHRASGQPGVRCSWFFWWGCYTSAVGRQAGRRDAVLAVQGLGLFLRHWADSIISRTFPAPNFKRPHKTEAAFPDCTLLKLEIVLLLNIHPSSADQRNPHGRETLLIPYVIPHPPHGSHWAYKGSTARNVSVPVFMWERC